MCCGNCDCGCGKKVIHHNHTVPAKPEKSCDGPISGGALVGAALGLAGGLPGALIGAIIGSVIGAGVCEAGSSEKKK